MESSNNQIRIYEWEQDTGSNHQPISALDLVLQDGSQLAREDWLSACSSRAIHVLLDRADRFAVTDAPVLIVGECGTGKQQLVHRIHEKARDRPLVWFMCGKLASALGGTAVREESWFRVLERTSRQPEAVWFFDGVDEAPTSFQPLISSLMDEIFAASGEFGTPSVISTASPRITELVSNGSFRKDLYYKLNVLELRIPPLRERKDDIAPLLSYFAQLQQSSARSVRFTSHAVALLCDFPWPGNVLELKNVVSKLAVLSETDVLDSKDLLRHWSPASQLTRTELMGLKLEEAETHLILDAISRCDGNKTAAAKQLGITARTLHNKMQKYRTLGLIE